MLYNDDNMCIIPCNNYHIYVYVIYCVTMCYAITDIALHTNSSLGGALESSNVLNSTHSLYEHKVGTRNITSVEFNVLI